MSKTSDRIFVIVDLLLGAAHADARLVGAEQTAVRELLGELLGGGELPPEVEARIANFSASTFDLAAVAREFAIDPLIQKRHLLELVAKVHEADDELDFDEDAYLVSLARALDVPEAEYDDLTLGIQIEDLRSHLARLRPPPPPKGRAEGLHVDVDLDE